MEWVGGGGMEIHYTKLQTGENVAKSFLAMHEPIFIFVNSKTNFCQTFSLSLGL